MSLAILDSPEFHDRGYFVLRLYLATLGRPPLREEFVKDHDAIFSTSTAELESRKDALIAEFIERAEFKSKYGGLSDAAFVKKLLATAEHPSTELGDKLVSLLQSKQKTRAQVVRVVVDHTANDPRFSKSCVCADAVFRAPGPRPEAFGIQRSIEDAQRHRRLSPVDFRLPLFRRVPKTLWLC